MKRVVVPILLVLSVVFSGTSVSGQTFETDENGSRYQTSFTLHDRSYLSVHQVHDTESGQGIVTRVEAGFDSGFELSYPKEEVWWMLRHRYLKLMASGRTGDLTTSNFGVTMLSGDYLRHDVSSMVLIPGDLDLKIPAPFDIGVMYRLGDMEANLNDGLRWTKFDILDVAILMDFVRDENYRHRFGVGAFGNYGLQRRDAGFIHHTSPFTMVRTRYGFDAKSGLFSLDATIDGGYAFEAPFGQSIVGDIRVKGEGELTLVPFAVNDIPVRLVAQGEFDWTQNRDIRWSSSLGLQLDFGYQ